MRGRCHRLILAGFVGFITIASGPTGVAQSELVITKEGTREYHWPGCDLIKDGKKVLALTRAQAAARGLTPHEECDPADAAEGKPRQRDDPTMVYTDSSRYYHKKNCEKLGKNAKKVELEQAGRKHWPCPDCKPPIRKAERAELAAQQQCHYNQRDRGDRNPHREFADLGRHLCPPRPVSAQCMGQRTDGQVLSPEL